MVDRIRHILRARSVKEHNDRVVEALKSIGLTRMYFQGPIANNRALGRVVSNFGFSKVWERAYADKWRFHDPIPEAAARNPGPMYWHRLPATLALTDDEKAYLDFLALIGMEQGICMLLFGEASRVALMAASTDRDGEPVEHVDQEFFRLIGLASFSRYCQLVTTDPELQVPLSGREMDVLYWMAQGHSNAGISEALGISQGTVNTYVKRIFAKMNVFDRTSAVMKGVQHGLVIVSDTASERVVGKRQLHNVGNEE